MYNIAKNRSRLIITRLNDGRVGEYDLATKKFYNHRLDGKITEVKGLSHLFTGTDVKYNNVYDWFEDKKYAEFVKYIASFENNVSNMSTILDRLSKYAHLEQYFAIGLKINSNKFRSYYRNDCDILEKPLSFYTKKSIKMFKDNSVELDRDVERLFVKHKNIEDILYFISEEHTELFNEYLNAFKRDYYFFDLVKDYKYDYKRLFEYLEYINNYEAFGRFSALRELKDYARMASAISRNGKFEKYPRYLKTIHDITARNFSSFEAEYNEILFNKAVGKYVTLEYSDKNYSIIVPKVSEDMKNESVSLSHCVASYVNDVINEKTQILFMRKDICKSLLTIEVKNDMIIQVKGSFNRSVYAEEREFIEKWAKNKKLKLANNI